MAQFIALILSALMTLTALGTGDSQPDVIKQLKDGWNTLVAAVQDNNKEASQPSAKDAATLYASPSKSGYAAAKLNKGEAVTILRIEANENGTWAYVRSNKQNVTGWLPIEQVNISGYVGDIIVKTKTEPVVVEEYIPPYAKLGIVTVNELNIRAGVGVNYDKVGTYRYGDRVAILETSGEWGRTNRGWVCMTDYIYLDGNMGRYAMYGNVTAERLNIRRGPGTKYSAVGTYSKNERIAILEQVRIGADLWGCTSQGWVSMNYIDPDYLPNCADRVYGYALVNGSGADVRKEYSADSELVKHLPSQQLVTIWQVFKVDGENWAYTPMGFVNMKQLTVTVEWNLESVIEIEPEEPTDPTEEPTDPSEPDDPTDPTDETTDPTEETTEATEETTEATEETTESTEETTESTEATEATEDTDSSVSDTSSET